MAVEIHPRLEQASTLPSACYLEAPYLELEKRAIFGQAWQHVGHLGPVQEPGSYFATEIAGQPIVVTRDLEGQLRAFHNVCRHRASVVAQGCGKAKSLQCPYHGWTYGLAGKLQGCREFEGVENFDKAENGLPPVRIETLGPLLFANLSSGGPSLSAATSGIAQEVSSLGIDLSSYRYLARRDYTVKCNWKVYVDNYLEGYHLPMVHPELYKFLDYSRYRVEPRGLYSAQFAPTREGTDKALYYWLFPNFMLNIYPDNLSTNLIVPMSADRTLTIFEWYVPQNGNGLSMEQTLAFSDQVQKEDISICELVQKGLKSSSYDRGRYSVARENGVHHFHRLWASLINGGTLKDFR